MELRPAPADRDGQGLLDRVAGESNHCRILLRIARKLEYSDFGGDWVLSEFELLLHVTCCW